MIWVIAAALAVAPLRAAELKPATMDAFERYVHQTERQLEERHTFLWADESAERARLVRQGQIVVEPAGAKPTIAVPDGLVHDWVGTVFVPGATLENTISVMEGYNHRE